MSSFSICRSLIANNRLFGAYSFLSQFEETNLHDCVIRYSIKALVLQGLKGDVNKTADRLALSLHEQMIEDEDIIRALLQDAHDKDVSYIFNQCCNSLKDIQTTVPVVILKLFLSITNGTEIKQTLIDYVLSCDELVICEDVFEDLFSDADFAHLRSLLSSLEGHRCSSLKAYLLEQLVSKTATPFWEHYNLAEAYSTLEKHSEALDHYRQFYEQALERGEQNATRRGLAGILRSVFYFPDNLAEYGEYYEKATKVVREDPEIQILVQELTLISDCRTALRQKSDVDDTEAGYQYLTKEMIQENIDALSNLTTIAPSHESFYQLFKLQAMMNNKEMAKEVLKNAYQANTLLLRVG